MRQTTDPNLIGRKLYKKTKNDLKASLERSVNVQWGKSGQGGEREGGRGNKGNEPECDIAAWLGHELYVCICLSVHLFTPFRSPC